MSTPPLHPPSGKFNFAAHLFDQNRARGGRTAFIDDEGSLSYADLEHRARRFARALSSGGVRREERVLLLMHDTVDWPVAFLGALYAGVVPVAVNTLLSADDYAYMIGHSRAQAAVVSAPLLPVLDAALASAKHEVRTVLVSRPKSSLSGAAIAFDDFLASEPAETAASTDGDDMAFWLYSSGSTGRPKGAVHTHANPYWTAELYGKRVLGLNESDVVFSAAKLFFAYGLGNALTFPLAVGATVVLMAERPTPDAVFKRWIERRPTIFYGAPTGYAGMLASPSLPRRDQVALRLCSSAGEALPREIGERFAAHFGSRSSTASARPRCCTSSSPIAQAKSVMERPASRSPATRSSFAATMGKASQTVRSATSTSADRAPRCSTGATGRRRWTRSGARGRRAATSTSVMQTATTPTRAEAMTC